MPVSLRKQVIEKGLTHGQPKVDDEVIVEYTGWLYDASRGEDHYKGAL